MSGDQDPDFRSRCGLAPVITLGPILPLQIFSFEGLPCSPPATPNIVGCFPFLVFLGGSCSSAQVRPPHRFRPCMGHKTCFGVRKCLLRVKIVKKNIFTPNFGGKTRNSSQNCYARSQIVKSSKNGSKRRFLGQNLIPYMFFGTRKPNLRSILKPEVELIVFLRMRSNKMTKNGEKCP